MTSATTGQPQHHPHCLAVSEPEHRPQFGERMYNLGFGEGLAAAHKAIRSSAGERAVESRICVPCYERGLTRCGCVADELQRLRASLAAAAACCPEDVGFPEYIAALTKQRDAAEGELRTLDALMARIDALDPFGTRYEKVGHMLRVLRAVKAPAALRPDGGGTT